MTKQIIDASASAWPPPIGLSPQDLPHGLVRPPAQVLEIIAAETAKFPAQIFTAEARQRMRDDLTLQFYFEAFGHEVLYRSKPDGPEVFAVGLEEIVALRQTESAAEQANTLTWSP